MRIMKAFWGIYILNKRTEYEARTEKEVILFNQTIVSRID